MLLTNYINEGDITTFGIGNTTNFGISVSGKAFKVLSDTLYTNKIGSIVRELSCNADDSHKAAGKADVPFEIHLPNMMEPWFSVKDFGIGMSDEQVRVNYCTLFLSTKDQNNDMIGAFGLGSKTPFAYTDNFTVISTYNGIRRSYAAVIQDDGTPSISEMGCEATTDGNGVEVIIGVDKQDWYTFAAEVKSQLRFFRVKPIITNNANFQFTTINHSDGDIITDDFILIENDSHPKFIAIQGGVGYPINMDMLNEKISDPLLSVWAYQILGNYGVYLNFNIGDIEVTPSRESISYNNLTIQNIIKMLEKVKASFTDEINNKIGKLPTLWERYCFVNGSNSSVIHAVYNDNIYNIPTVLSFDLSFIYEEKNVPVIINLGTDQEREVDLHQKHFIYKVRHYHYSKRTYRYVLSNKYDDDKKIDALDSVNIVIMDTCEKSATRLRYFLDSASANKHYYVFVRDDGKFCDQNDIEIIKQNLGDVKPLLVSSFPMPNKIDKERLTYRAPKCWKLKNIYDANNNIRSVHKEEIDEKIKNIEEKSYYLIVGSNGDIGWADNSKIKSLRNSRNRMIPAHIAENVYLIRQKDYSKIENDPSWVDLNMALVSVYDAFVQKNILSIRKLLFKEVVEDIFQSIDCISCKQIGLMSKHSQLKKFFKLSSLKGRYRKNNGMLLCEVERKKIQQRLDRQRDELYNKYPLIFRCIEGFGDMTVTMIDHIDNYVDMIDNNSKS